MVVMMAEKSDNLREAAGYWDLLRQEYDAAFGSRFIKGGGVIDYPTHKLILNRAFNLIIRLLGNLRCRAHFGPDLGHAGNDDGMP